MNLNLQRSFPRSTFKLILLAGAVMAGWMGGAAAAQPSGLVAAYGFEEGSGTSAIDSSGQGNGGTISGASRTTGRFGLGLDFDGAGALVTVPDSISLDLTTGMTLEAWVYPKAGNFGFRDVVFKGLDGAYFLAGCSPNGGVPDGGGTLNGEVYGLGKLPENSWSHLAMTCNQVSLRLYVDGVEVANHPQTALIQTTTGDLTLGGDPVNGQYWTGKIDEVRIYNRALSASEIQADMAIPVASGPSDTSPPVVTLIAPIPSSTVSHVVTITAEASDNVLVTEVEFFLDDASIGALNQRPFSIHWNSTTAINGLHTLKAVASDIAGNSTTSAEVTVTALNPAFVNEVVVPDITSAVTLVFLPDGRMLVGELIEKIWVVQPGASQADPNPFLTIDSSNLFGEQGLMDIALDPDFIHNGFYYIFYTRTSPGSHNHNRVSRFTASGNGTVPGSELVLWQDSQEAEEEHHAGAVVFGADGKLYFTLGEQFIANNAQNMNTYRGKVLRLNPDGSFPPDNPFFDGSGLPRDAIWALGVRNPYRMSFDKVSGKMYFGDVGGNDNAASLEEVNVVQRGANYGWPLCEGLCGVAGTTDPLYAYPHSDRDACVTGGFIYRGSQFPSEYYGNYFFADFVQNTIRRLTFDDGGNVTGDVSFWPADGSTDGPLVGDPVKLIEGPDGSLYYIDLGFTGFHFPNPAAIRRIRYSISDLPPVVSVAADPLAGLAPLEVSFSSAGSFDPDGQELTYSWTFGDGASSTEANPTHTYPAEGIFIARLTASDGLSTTLSNNLTINVGRPPHATILSPADGMLFRAGDLISFSGTGVDAAGDPLPISAFSWSIVFHHEGHIHPGLGPLTGTRTGTFPIPIFGHDFEGFTRYEIALTVTSPSGLTDIASVTIFPEKVNLTFETDPAGLDIEVDGIRKTTPFVLGEVIGFFHEINAPHQATSGARYDFSSWSDGGAQDHLITTTTQNATYRATYLPTSLPSGLVAAYAFEEGSGAMVADSSGNGHQGSIQDAVWTPDGRFGKALEFDGAESIVSVQDSPLLDLASAMTLEAWVVPTETRSLWKDVIYKGFSDNYYLEGSSENGGAPAVGGTFSSPPAVDSAPLPERTWSHLAGTYDGAMVRLYVNGVEVSSHPQTGVIETSDGPLTLGGDFSYGQYWKGRIDEVRIYNRALSAEEIQTDMTTPVSLDPVNLPPVAAASAHPTSGTVPLEVSFSSSGSFDPEGAPLTYLWIFADQSTSTEPNPSHTFQQAGDYNALLGVSDGVHSVTASVSISVKRPETFWRGNVNGDQAIDISDPVALLFYLFLNDAENTPCLKSADFNADDKLDITDVVLLLDYTFQDGPPPAPPFPTCGLDPSSELTCDSFPACH